MQLRPIVLCLLVLLWQTPPSSTAIAQAVAEAGQIEGTEINQGPTALDDYVNAPDDSYKWNVVGSQAARGVTMYVIDLTSQTWLSPDKVNRTKWKHWVTVLVPDGAKADTAMMFIDGGSNGRQPPTAPDPLAAAVAMSTRSVVASVGQIPNQPLVFHGDDQNRVEDDLIGYTWDQYLKTGDALWAARMPMTKAVVRAMDCVQELSNQQDFVGPKIEHYVVAGGSKRGWTTWTTAIVDKRVKAIAPIVIDVLNTNLSMQHHYAAYGFWAPAITDYVNHKITHRRHHPRHKELLQLVDPFAYRDRLTLPKCIINATGDQFFVPDSSRFYFDELTGEKHLCYVPNGEHSLGGTNAPDTLAAFHHCIVNDIPRPSFDWTFPDDNTIKVSSKTKPTRVLLWQANNPKARDFRVDTIGRTYRESTVEQADDGTWEVNVKDPAEGWTAYVVQLEFNVGAAKPMRLTTPVRIVPDTLPFADKQAPSLPVSAE